MTLDPGSALRSGRDDSQVAPAKQFCQLAEMDHSYWVYILASRRNGTLYVGVTNDLARRVFEHKAHVATGFTSRYDVTLLVWYEHYSDVSDAISREKSLKRWRRAWKLSLVESMNPQWRDLYLELNQ